MRLSRRTLIPLLAAALGLAAPIPAAAQEQPLLLVADLAASGISDLEMKLLVDLYSYTIFETGAYLVMNRYERNKLLRGFGFSQRNLEDRKVYREAAELLRAGFIVTGACRRSGGLLTVTLSLWDVAGDRLLKTAESAAPDFPGLIEMARALTGDLTGKAPSFKTPAGREGLSASLYVTPIRERILIVLPEKPLPSETAAARLLVSEAAARVPEDGRFQIFFSSAVYDTARPEPARFAPALLNRDCHTLALVTQSGSAFALTLYDPGLAAALSLPFALRGDRAEAARALSLRMEKEIPLPPPLVLARELEREIKIKEKLDELLFNEKFISQRWLLNIHTAVFNPAVAGKYHPLLDIVSAEIDLYYYYSDLLGLGAGYAYSLGYPATLDSKLISHPLIGQHEFRLVPLSFRSAGQVSVLLNLITALCLQNAYRIRDPSGTGDYVYDTETALLSFKIALTMGILFNITDQLSAYLNLAALSMIFPLNIGAVSFDGTNITGSGGGVGVIVRF